MWVSAMCVPCVCHVCDASMLCVCNVSAMSLQCVCHASAVYLPCDCLVSAMFLPCVYRVSTMCLPYVSGIEDASNLLGKLIKKILENMLLNFPAKSLYNWLRSRFLSYNQYLSGCPTEGPRPSGGIFLRT